MHFTLIIAVPEGMDYERMMERYYQDLEVPGRWGCEISDDEKQGMLEWYKETDFEECYKNHGYDWNGGAWRKNSKGVWTEWITWNEEARWDWYEVGGRWPGRLELKADAETEPNVSFSWGWREDKDAMDKFLEEHPRNADIAKKGEVANLETLTSYSLLIDGEWIDVDGPVYEYLKDLDDDVELVCIDYHM